MSGRFYDTTLWRESIRPAQLAREPLCRLCKERGRIVAATEVDHIVPISQGGSEIHQDNLQSLCTDCHSRKTAADQGKSPKLGCDVNGVPVARKTLHLVRRKHNGVPVTSGTGN